MFTYLETKVDEIKSKNPLLFYAVMLIVVFIWEHMMVPKETEVNPGGTD